MTLKNNKLTSYVKGVPISLSVKQLGEIMKIPYVGSEIWANYKPQEVEEQEDEGQDDEPKEFYPHPHHEEDAPKPSALTKQILLDYIMGFRHDVV